MKPMDELRAARPAHLDAPTDPGTRARELEHAFSQHRRTASRRGLRPMWGLGLAGAVTASAVVVATAGLFDAERRVVVSPPAASSPSEAATVALDARTVLLAAASRSEAQQERPDAWWRSESVQRTIARVQGEPAYNIYEVSRTEMWTPYEPGGEQVNTMQRLAFQFPTPEDEAAWKRAGSPSKVTVQAPKPAGPGSSELGSYEVERRPGKPSTSRSRLVDGDKVFWLGKNVTMRELRELPDDPKRLKAWLLASYEGHDTESTSVPMASDVWLYRVATGLIADMPVTPKVRGAAFRMLAELETVQVIENVTDVEGRTGAAVAMKEEVRGAVLLNRLVFDRETGRPLQNDSVVVDPGGRQAELPEGALWNAVTIVSSEWAGEKP